jgi:predicted AlkP superfamily phosphohydrolase/phosphomutase
MTKAGQTLAESKSTGRAEEILIEMSENKRVLVIGIDGATFDLLRPWMEDGSLPNLAAVARNGASGELQSTLPPNSAPAWTSFMTGMNPGKHGVYGFTRVEPREGYAIKVNSGMVRRPQTVWQLLTQQGRRSIVLNVPMTYPPDPIDGVVVAGIDTPGLESQFTYPPELRHKIFRLLPDYILDIRSWGVTAVGERRAHLLDDILRMIDVRKRLALHLMATQPWDLCTVVFTATDRAQHFFWRFLDRTHPLYDPAEAPKYHDAILRVYRQIDQALGEMLARCGDETNVIVMSDHGFGPQHRLFRINQWMVEKGFLQLTCTASNGLVSCLSSAVQRWLYRGLGSVNRLARAALSDKIKDRLKRRFPHLREQVASQILFSGVDWSRTQAYHTAEFPGSIRVNMKGREANGIVDPGAEYEAVCEAIQSGLKGYVDPDTGKRIVERVFRREELYWGPCLDEAPDLIVHLADYAYTIDWYMPVAGKGAGSEPSVVDALTGAYAVNCGSHRLSGILMLYGPDIRGGAQLEPNRIYDVVPTVLYLLGEPVPADMDGRVLTAAITADMLDRRPVERRDPTSTPVETRSPGQVYSDEESEAIADRLRNLGYL